MTIGRRENKETVLTLPEQGLVRVIFRDKAFPFFPFLFSFSFPFFLFLSFFPFILFIHSDLKA